MRLYRPCVPAALAIVIAMPSAALAQEAATTPETDEPEVVSKRFRAHAALFAGPRQMENAWEPVANPFQLGGIFSFGRDHWPVDIAVDFFKADAGGCEFLCFGTPASAKTSEYDLGVRKFWRPGHVWPYVGGGTGFIDASFDVDDGTRSAHSSDFVPSFWAETGVLFRLGPIFDLGLDVRYSYGNARIDFGSGEQDAKTGGFQYGILLGVGVDRPAPRR